MNEKDKYYFYLRILAEQIGLHEFLQKKIIVRINPMHPLESILFVTRKYKHDYRHNSELISKLIGDYIIKRGIVLYKDDIYEFYYPEIKEDEELLNIVENSWIADDARFFATCVDMLEEKHKNSFDVFEELIDS